MSPTVKALVAGGVAALVSQVIVNRFVQGPATGVQGMEQIAVRVAAGGIVTALILRSW
jgi:hypothetical protein